jgi:hypothetical protein
MYNCFRFRSSLFRGTAMFSRLHVHLIYLRVTDYFLWQHLKSKVAYDHRGPKAKNTGKVSASNEKP